MCGGTQQLYSYKPLSVDGQFGDSERRRSSLLRRSSIRQTAHRRSPSAAFGGDARRSSPTRPRDATRDVPSPLVRVYDKKTLNSLFVPLVSGVPDYGTRGDINLRVFSVRSGWSSDRDPGRETSSPIHSIFVTPHFSFPLCPHRPIRARWAVRHGVRWGCRAKPCLWTRSTPTER